MQSKESIMIVQEGKVGHLLQDMRRQLVDLPKSVKGDVMRPEGCGSWLPPSTACTNRRTNQVSVDVAPAGKWGGGERLP